MLTPSALGCNKRVLRYAEQQACEEVEGEIATLNRSLAKAEQFALPEPTKPVRHTFCVDMRVRVCVRTYVCIRARVRDAGLNVSAMY